MTPPPPPPPDGPDSGYRAGFFQSTWRQMTFPASDIRQLGPQYNCSRELHCYA